MTKDLISGYQMPNGTKYFYLGIFHNYLVFIPAKKFTKKVINLHISYILNPWLKNLNTDF